MSGTAASDEEQAASERLAADVITFVDEAGLSGLVRNLTPALDCEIGLMCALPIRWNTWTTSAIRCDNSTMASAPQHPRVPSFTLPTPSPQATTRGVLRPKLHATASSR